MTTSSGGRSNGPRIYSGGDDLPYTALETFKADAPMFVTDAIYRDRLEEALVKADAPAADLIRLLGGEMPVSAKAQIELAAAYLAEARKSARQASPRPIWTEEILDASTERRVLDKLGSLLTADDHWARAVHLMMHDRASATERLFGFLTEGQKLLARARNATSREAKNGKALLDALPEEWQSDPIYIYTRVQRARPSGLYASAVDWLDKAPSDVPDSAEWWYERRAIIRKLLEAGEEKLAYRAAAGYTEGPDGRVVEAHFHAGYIALSFLDDAATAETHFAAMTGHSTLPESVAQANYWLGRARLALGKDEAAKEAFTVAAAYPTIYYGQLSRAALGLAELRSPKHAQRGRQPDRVRGARGDPRHPASRRQRRRGDGDPPPPRICAAARYRRRTAACGAARAVAGVPQSRDHHRRGGRGARHAARPLQLPQGRDAG